MKVSNYWKQCNRTESRFSSRYAEFLNENLYDFDKSAKLSKENVKKETKRKDFDDLSDSQKRRRTSGMYYILTIFWYHVCIITV